MVCGPGLGVSLLVPLGITLLIPLCISGRISLSISLSISGRISLSISGRVPLSISGRVSLSIPLSISGRVPLHFPLSISAGCRFLTWFFILSFPEFFYKGLIFFLLNVFFRLRFFSFGSRIATFNVGFLAGVGRGGFYDPFTLLGIFILGICFFAGDHGLFVQNFINEFLLAEFFGTGYFQLLCDIEQFGNEHVV